VKYVHFLTEKCVNKHRQAYYNGPCGSGAIVTAIVTQCYNCPRYA